MINIEIIGNENESNANLLRRFTKRVRSSGVIKKLEQFVIKLEMHQNSPEKNKPFVQ